ncbi:hypothetical protein DMB66_23980 [Actinoplanes sp. ATCC 53533]|uniref:hypothetical protein n=1 Tax=Actinoplanes sp. ATCC 53533 TaxID=1288362 RepID=UPI000F77B842|nr:hypothetical protein [Actinoplanes sp. ATCC 53533]RSM61762.1 hypothetical protein DMB66_23980 [Actinoplanes sp. ATCC 53533]
MYQPIADAFSLLRETHPQAATLVVEVAAKGDAIWLHAVRGSTGELLWFDEDNYGRHPDATATGGSPELDYSTTVRDTVEDHLLAAYQGAARDAFAAAADGDYQGLLRREGRALMIISAGELRA